MSDRTVNDLGCVPAELPYFHTVGIGAGPANLSLAALFESATTERIALFDAAPGPSWHADLLYSGVRMQTGWLKDLVSLVDPRHKLTFHNYLVTTGRLYALLNAQFDAIPRIEYQRYLAWAAEQIGNISYSSRIDRVSFGEGGFTVHSDGKPLARSEHLVLGVGTRPMLPAYLGGLPADQVFIADGLAARLDAMRADTEAPVAVIGAGQTGIECVFRLLGAGFTDISWFGRHQWFQSIDDSPIANDIYRPQHVDYMQELTRTTRRQLIADHKLTGDALTPGALRALYQANYDGMLELGRYPVTLLPHRDVTSGERDGNDIVLRCTSPERREEYRFRHVVVAAGREATPLPLDDELRERIDLDDENEMIVESDFSVRWKGMNGHKIYALGASRYSHGLTNAGLTLLPVRAARVVNSMFGTHIYQVRDELSPVRW
ncbi:lysine/ornithine N-monooxygenase [Allocatelliglobosispora scoriae]|uniref:L-lysine N6-monooxygenase MbtG n=1 Tax=Allocatelliglobosispora scoriae TaxID=643052 RepID=A0A841BQ22_9ACTN|nr:SidA/IucD/PvdA family monooxygenase [Allocatelliglobosispora scoriae]MBB5869043.1 lysine/ornithine N-monooxygenase [Allocatelliglobosispora scoriae]